MVDLMSIVLAFPMRPNMPDLVDQLKWRHQIEADLRTRVGDNGEIDGGGMGRGVLEVFLYAPIETADKAYFACVAYLYETGLIHETAVDFAQITSEE